jgi:hypothetical protein
MKTRTSILALGLAAALASPLLAQADKPKAPPAAPTMDQGMEAMMKAAQPGEQHKILNGMVGDWTYTMKMWMDPKQPAMESNGTMHAEWILGGRYVQSVYKGDMMGQPFEGHGTDGYDNLGHQYVGSWVDNMGTGIMNTSGTCEAAAKTCTMMSEMLDPMSGQKVATKMVTTYAEDGFQFAMFVKDPTGHEFKTMEAVAKKKK